MHATTTTTVAVHKRITPSVFPAGDTPTSTRTPDVAAIPIRICCATWLPTVPTSTSPVTSAPMMAPTVLAA